MLTEKYSYSKLNTFENCPYKFKLMYMDNHYVSIPSIATDFGTLIHSIEENIGQALIKKETINYNDLINYFKEEINKLKLRYPYDFYEVDKSGRNYEGKSLFYIKYGIYRLENRIKANKNLNVVFTEKEFNLIYNNINFVGFIDRVLYDSLTDTYIVEDIKTYSKKLEPKDLKTPLQHVIYSMALKNILGDTIKLKCSYDLPLCDCIQDVDDKYYDLGVKKLDKLLEDIKISDFEPKPTPLCHWCVYSKTFPNQPDQAKKLCPYYSLWTKSNRTNAVHEYWLGKENHDIIMEKFKKEVD